MIQYNNICNDKNKIMTFLAMALIILIFDIPSIFQYKSLYQDDLTTYLALISGGKYDSFIPYGYKQGISGMLLDLLGHILVYSPVLARLSLVLFFIIPLSSLLYYLYCRILRLPRLLSFTAVILPNIAASQVDIPIFLWGSYTVYGMLLFTISIYFMWRFQNSLEFKVHYYLLFLFFTWMQYISSIHMLFLFPVTLLLMLFSRKSYKRLLFAIVPVVAAAVYSYIIYKRNPSVSQTPVALSHDQILDRLSQLFLYVDPFYPKALDILKIPATYILMSIVFIVITGFVSAIINRKQITENINPDEFYLSPIKYVILIYLTALTGFIPTVLPFVFCSPFFESRHAFVGDIFYSLLIAVIMYSLVSFIKNKSVVRWTLVGACSILILYSGINRFERIGKLNAETDIEIDTIEGLLSPMKLPVNSQVVIQNYGNTLHGYGLWEWSSAILEYIMNRPDISGCFPDTKNFYDPFQKVHFQKMTNLNENYPLFLFYYDGQRFNQYKYALQWLSEGDINSSWVVYKLDPVSGKVDMAYKGQGWTGYVDTLKSNNIKQEEIGFGQGELAPTMNAK